MAQLLRMPEVAANTNEAVLGIMAGPRRRTVRRRQRVGDRRDGEGGRRHRGRARRRARPALVDAGQRGRGRQRDRAARRPRTSRSPTPTPSSRHCSANRSAHHDRRNPTPLRRRRDCSSARSHEGSRATPASTVPSCAGRVRTTASCVATSRPPSPPSAARLAASRRCRSFRTPAMRTAIAANLVASKRDVPHFYLRGTADVDALLRLASRLEQRRGAAHLDQRSRAQGCRARAHPRAGDERDLDRRRRAYLRHR